MGIGWILLLVLGIPILTFIVFLVISSCLGDHFRFWRPSLTGFPINPRRGTYDQTYFRTMTNHPPPGTSEQIEMENMLDDRDRQGEQDFD